MAAARHDIDAERAARCTWRPPRQTMAARAMRRRSSSRLRNSQTMRLSSSIHCWSALPRSPPQPFRTNQAKASITVNDAHHAAPMPSPQQTRIICPPSNGAFSSNCPISRAATRCGAHVQESHRRPAPIAKKARGLRIPSSRASDRPSPQQFARTMSSSGVLLLIETDPERHKSHGPPPAGSRRRPSPAWRDITLACGLPDETADELRNQQYEHLAAAEQLDDRTASPTMASTARVANAAAEILLCPRESVIRALARGIASRKDQMLAT